ncbi:LysR family transcriptional regulator [Inquilinus sp. NPDC058860]|uniref:LysR family transcriptional regulator n=1 Tax=Inquilinus sp. NPDC058860 TaxID=3346652 RepID=UPI0036A3FD08
MARPDLSDLAAFAAVARHRSFRRAAIELGVSASAVSHAIRGLEERLGVRLLNRTTRSVTPTEAGERLLARLQPAFRDIAEAVEEVNQFRHSPVGTLKINASIPAAALVLAPMVARFLAAYPDIRLEVAVDSALVDVVASGFDAGIRLGEQLERDMVAVRFGGEQRLIVVAAPSYLAGRAPPQTPRDLAEHRCIGYRFPSGQVYAWEFEQDGRELTVPPAGPLIVDEQWLIIRSALDGAGLAFVFEEMVTAELAEGRLVPLLQDWSPPFPGFFLYYPRQRQMPAALRAFVDFVRADNVSRSRE